MTPGDATQPGALTQLIRDAARDDSYGALASKAIDPISRTTVSKAYLHKLAGSAPPAHSPSEAQLRAIAAAVRLPEQVVQRAAAEQWLGYVATELAGYTEDVRIIVAHLAGKPPTEVRRWRAMMEAEDRAAGDG